MDEITEAYSGESHVVCWWYCISWSDYKGDSSVSGRLERSFGVLKDNMAFDSSKNLAFLMLPDGLEIPRADNFLCLWSVIHQDDEIPFATCDQSWDWFMVYCQSCLLSDVGWMVTLYPINRNVILLYSHLVEFPGAKQIWMHHLFYLEWKQKESICPVISTPQTCEWTMTLFVN